MARISTIFSRVVRNSELSGVYGVKTQAAVSLMAVELMRNSYVCDIAYSSTFISQNSSRWDDVKFICEGLARSTLTVEL